MFQILVAAGVPYLLLGDPGEALMLLAFVVMTATITVVQGQRAGKALEALRDLSSPRALVIRDGQAVRIAGREVVRGDLPVLTGRAAPTSREASLLVLPDEDVGSIVHAMRRGRSIDDNPRTAMTFFFAVHVPIAGAVAAAAAGRPARRLQAGAHCLPRAADRPGVLDRLRVRGRGGRCDGPATARPGCAAAQAAMVGRPFAMLLAGALLAVLAAAIRRLWPRP